MNPTVRVGRRTQLERLRGPRGLIGVLALILCGVALSVPNTSGDFTARIVNTANTVSTAAAFNCAGAATAANAYYVYSLDEALPILNAALVDVSGNARNGNYRGLASLHSTAQGCNRDGGGSTTFGGGSYASTPNQINSPQIFTTEVWFRTSSTSGGYLMGFGNTQTGLPSVYDRHVYMTNAGKLVFGTYNGATQVITSPLSYNNGAWHHVAATFGPAGMILYVDGVNVGTNTNTTAETNNGYWRIAYGNLTSWPTPPTNNYFTGQLDFFAYYQTVLSPAVVAAHYAVGT